MNEVELLVKIERYLHVMAYLMAIHLVVLAV